MFTNDNSILADILWSEYTKVVKENMLLKAQLEVATKVVQSLNVQIGDMRSAEEAGVIPEDV